MAAETGLILGLLGVAYIIHDLATGFEEKKDKIHKSLMAFSVLFIAGMEYTAIGIAQSKSLPKAENAYTFALMVTLLVFLGMIYRIIMQMKEEAQKDSSMKGLGE